MGVLWQAGGPGLSFREADRLSITDKEFIDALFPPISLYVCMLPLEVQKQIGQVGCDTEGAVHLLKKVGLRFLNHVDPFDRRSVFMVLQLKTCCQFSNFAAIPSRWIVLIRIRSKQTTC